ncbi:MAG TPA: FKBP-type peptidyl-prolyl cis-trans isomerase [Polyangiaceae bacterium]|jgi:peptidylprolyl isomerase|nr:FKBP-type peptidyl-prolyl cis-trans isomerase [Polyangiaceae bacterium]
MKRLALLFVVACGDAVMVPESPAPLPTVTVTADAPLPPKKHDVGELQTTASGLQYIDERIGDGASPAAVTSTVTVHYNGMLADGTKFDSSYDRGQPFKSALKNVIKGWQEGVLTMHVGGKRRLIIPAELAYGSHGAGGKIPPNATLTFDIELLGVEDVP